MTNVSLRRISVIFPILFWVVMVIVRLFLIGPVLSWQAELLVLLIYSLGVILFSSWIFQVVEQREAEARRRTEQLAALNEAAIALSKELDLGTVLQNVVDLARELVRARYGALGVIDEPTGGLVQFITSGISPEERAKMAHLPRGHGLLGVMIKEGKPIRISSIPDDERTVGFPPHHPQMRTFLGVPIKFKGKVYGDLYLADKQPDWGNEEEKHSEFSAEDQQVLEMFAIQAAIAIENAQLYRQIQQLVILQERERFGMDLHDGIIQSIYAIGLMLEDTQHRIVGEPEKASNRIYRAIHELNDVISDIRNYILDLRPQRFQGRDLERGLQELVREIRANTFLNVHLSTDGLDLSPLSAEQTVEILHIAQEALTNVRKHARATNVDIDLSVHGEKLQMMISDNGIGIDQVEIPPKVGNGLRNMRERANALLGDIRIEPGDRYGTRVILSIPLKDRIVQ